MEIIDELEPVRRGLYTGATGWLGAAGDLDLAVAIRTALVRGDRLTLSVGGGIVADSVPRRSWPRPKRRRARSRRCARAAELQKRSAQTTDGSSAALTAGTHDARATAPVLAEGSVAQKMKPPAASAPAATKPIRPRRPADSYCVFRSVHCFGVLLPEPSVITMPFERPQPRSKSSTRLLLWSVP